MTASGEKETRLSSFCSSCGKPVRWDVRVSDKKRNEEFCPDCEPYAAKIIACDMKIQKMDRISEGRATDLAVQIQIEQILKERDVAIRVLDTIRTGWLSEAERIAQSGFYYRMKKPVSN